MPGVSVVVKNDTTGAHRKWRPMPRADTRTALGAGAYTVTASLAGFKTAAAKGVRVAPGQPVTIPLTLEVGQLTETVVVTSSSELINTQNGTVAATLNSDQLTRMPTPTRNALNAVTFLPGVNTPGTNRDSTINGLPERFLSITLDGVSNNDNFLRNTDGFFASVTPRQDAVEAVSVTLAAAGAQVGGGAGAVTMAFQTRSGGNRFTGSAYEYYRNPSFNSNYIFNEINGQGEERGQAQHVRRARRRADRDSRPLRRPRQGVLLRPLRADPLPEQLHAHAHGVQPARLRRLVPLPVRHEVREVNLLPLAAANGQIAATDPTMIEAHRHDRRRDEDDRHAHAPRAIRSTTTTSGRARRTLFEHQPTVRLDYNLTDNHRLSGSWSYITAKRTPDYLNNADPRFPGAPNQRDFVSTRPLSSVSLRSVLSQEPDQRAARRADGATARLEFRLSVERSRRATIPSTLRRSGRLRDHDADQHHRLVHVERPSWRAAPTYSIDETLTWLKGAHTLTLRRQRAHLERQVLGPADGPRDHSRLQHGLRSGGRDVHHDELPGRVEPRS